VIHSAGSDLLQLIDDILDLSKVEAGKMDVDVERIELRRLLDYVEATFRPLTTQKGLAFTVRTEPGVPGELLTDDARLRQVLRNLLSNAVKFTETGAVELTIGPAAAEELPRETRHRGAMLALRVRDTGIGIPGQQLETIFGAFQQADGTTSRKYGGTGLGLSISREIARLLGGAIIAQSTVGEGSVFTLYLPVANPEWGEVPPARDQEPVEASAAAVPTEPAPPAPGTPSSPDTPESRARRVLVIEDRGRGGLLSLVAENAAENLAGSQAMRGVHDRVQITAASDAQEAAAILAAEPHHCVVLALDMTGDAAARFLQARAEDPALRSLPVLAYHNGRLSLAQNEMVRSHAENHPLEVLSGLDDLRERIALHLSAERPDDVLPLDAADDRQPMRLAADDGALGGRTVLVVDDDARNVFALTGMLEFQGMRVLHAENGLKGIELLKANPDTELILMDVMMPEMDGYEATSAIREMPEYAQLPIVTVTAKAMPGDREKCLAAGATDYVTKPVDAAMLFDVIHRCLRV
jgi:CheY-like chemotaxis protein